jgi:hypothetical protein
VTGTDDPTDEELAATVDRVLRDVERVYDEFDRGYIDADVALDRIRAQMDDLEDAAED